MVAIASVATTALLVLRQSALAPQSLAQRAPAQESLLATANGSPEASPAAKSRGRIAEALFDRSAPDVTEMKVHLYERLGKAFGISMEDFDSPGAFGSAIAEKISQMKRDPGGSMALMEIEKKLGLDKLGISLDTLVDAIINVGGDSDKKLTEALVRKLGEDASTDRKDGAVSGALQLQRDEIGLYGV